MSAPRHITGYDLPQEVTDQIASIAEQVGTSASQVARFLLLRGWEMTDLDELYQVRQPAQNGCRYAYNLPMPKAKRVKVKAE
jgi:hypothetical protein